MCRGWKLLLMSHLPLKGSVPLKLQPEFCEPEGTEVHEESFSPTEVPFHCKAKMKIQFCPISVLNGLCKQPVGEISTFF